MLVQLVFLLAVATLAVSQHDPHFVGNRSVIVHLFEWKWNDIANECEKILSPKGYGGVQVSPVNENVVAEGRPWWERYQPVSYLLKTRSGNEAEFRNMVKRCNAVGVRIYVDALLNHMAASHPVVIGTGGSTADVPNKIFPAVPYTSADFHPSCVIKNYDNANEVRNCELSGLVDLDQSKPHVRERILIFLNNLIDMGVTGFRFDAAKHMWPSDLAVIYSSLKNLSTAEGFPPQKRPFIFQEVIDLGGEAVKKTEYNTMGAVTEFKHSTEIGNLFHGNNQLKWMKNWGPEWNFLPSRDALVFVDNHDNQRGHGAGGSNILTYKHETAYKFASAFMLAHPYGIARVMSSFNFSSPDQGPPSTRSGEITSPSFSNDGYCVNGWVCEHRWKEIVNMVAFRNIVKGTELSNWWDNGNNQIAFCRGNKGFILINNEDNEVKATLNTCLPKGTYCDVFSGNKQSGKCTGRSFTVPNNGRVSFDLPKGKTVIALHTNAKL